MKTVSVRDLCDDFPKVEEMLRAERKSESQSAAR